MKLKFLLYILWNKGWLVLSIGVKVNDVKIKIKGVDFVVDCLIK